MTPTLPRVEIQKLVREIEGLRGEHLLTFIVPPGDNLRRVKNMIVGREGLLPPNAPPSKRNNEEERVRRRRHLEEAVAPALDNLQRAKMNCPPNGMVMFCGTCCILESPSSSSSSSSSLEELSSSEEKHHHINYAFEPWKPLDTSLFLDDTKFHTEDLEDAMCWTTTTSRRRKRFVFLCHYLRKSTWWWWFLLRSIGVEVDHGKTRKKRTSLPDVAANNDDDDDDKHQGISERRCQCKGVDIRRNYASTTVD